MGKASPFCRLTAAMEPSGVFLKTDPDGGVRVLCHKGDETGLKRWDTPEVRGYISDHEAELWAWLRQPVDDLPAADRHALYGRLGAFGRTGGGA